MEQEKFVLLVEDDPAIREALTDVLDMESVKVESASNGAEGLSFLQKGMRPSVILLDLMMPGTDGQWFRAEQQKDSDLSKIPVVLMSAHGQTEAMVIKMGVQGCLKKPIRIEDLLNMLAKFDVSSGPAH